MKYDIEIAEEEFKKFWEQEHKPSLMTEQELEQYKMNVHYGFIKGFLLALDQVAKLYEKKVEG